MSEEYPLKEWLENAFLAHAEVTYNEKKRIHEAKFQNITTTHNQEKKALEKLCWRITLHINNLREQETQKIIKKLCNECKTKIRNEGKWKR